jgi:integrase
MLAALDAKPRSTRIARIIRFCLATGCRPGEACVLRWDMLSDDGRAFVLPAHKTARRTGLPRTIYLSPEALAAVAPEHSASNSKAPVFCSPRGRPYTPAGLRTAVYRASGRKLHPYILRHTFAQIAHRQVRPDVLMQLMGHRSLQTTLLYYRVEDRDALAALDALSVLPPAAPPARTRPRTAAGPASRARRAPGTRPASPRKSASVPGG